VRRVQDGDLCGATDVVETSVLGPLICKTTTSQYSASVSKELHFVPLWTWLAPSHDRLDVRIVSFSVF
jgi:hypothetical protein